jgi:prepilin-type processing-associated H-X9-DG protein
MTRSKYSVSKRQSRPIGYSFAGPRMDIVAEHPTRSGWGWGRLETHPRGEPLLSDFLHAYDWHGPGVYNTLFPDGHAEGVAAPKVADRAEQHWDANPKRKPVKQGPLLWQGKLFSLLSQAAE